MTDSEEKKEARKIILSFRKMCSEAGRLLDYRGPGNIQIIPAFILIFALAVSMSVGTSIRLESSELPFTEQLAVTHHNNLIIQDAATLARQKSPNLPQEYVGRQAEETLEKARETNQYLFSTGVLTGQRIPDLKAQDSLVSENIKAYFQDEEGTPYLPDIDTYYWYRYAENVVETGDIADEIRDGKKFDNHQLAPLGLKIDLPAYAYAIAYFHKIMGKPAAMLLGKPESLTLSFAIFPVFLMALVSLLAFFITRSIAGGMSGFFAAVIVGIHPNLIGRTLFGRGDSDAFVIFLAMLVTWCAVNAFASSNLKWRVLWAFLAGLATGIYSNSWPGWWWIFVLIMASSGLSVAAVVLYQVAVNNIGKNFRISEINFLKIWSDLKSSIFQIGTAKNLSIVLTYFFSSAFFVSIFSNVQKFLFALFPSSSVNIKTPISESVLPNVLRTVAELSEGSVKLGIEQLGGEVLFTVAVAGIVLLLLKDFFSMRRDSEEFRHSFLKNVFFVLLIAFWFGMTLFAVTKGIRFTILAVPALSIAVGLALGIIGERLASFCSKHFKTGKPIAFVCGFVIVLVLGYFAVDGLVEESFERAGGDVPIVNDAWVNSLTEIKQNSRENAIITSWWDFGHHFKYIADRPVTFDGATQTEPQAHWVGRMLSASNEREAIGILRMLNCGAREGTDLIQETVGDSARSFEITKRIILEDRSEALKILTNEDFSRESADKVLERTHCSPPESFVIASEDMIGKAGVWGHFGAWNFTRADMVRAVQGKTLEESVSYATSKFGMSRKEAEDIFFEVQLLLDDAAIDNWISPWPGFYHIDPNCLKDGNVILCESGILVNLENENVELFSEEDALPRSLSYLSEEGIVRKEYENSTLEYSLIVFPQGKTSYGAILASPEIVDGTFMRMFFLQGHGLKCFSFFTSETGIFGNEVHVWKADWGCQQKNVISGLASEARPGDSVSISYIGYFDNRTVFDSSIQYFSLRNVTPENSLLSVPLDAPLNFTLGRNQVIPGFENGIVGMIPGEEKVIRIPPEEGYTHPGHHLYNKTLNFRVRLVKIT